MIKRLTILGCVRAAFYVPVLTAGTLTGLTGDLDTILAGQHVVFSPTGGDNLTVVGPFAGAAIGVPFPAETTMLNFASGAVQFVHGTYILGLQLEPLTHSLGSVTPTGPGTFSSFFDVFFDATFNKVGSGSGDNSGDVLGEFGGLPGISDCVNGAVSTCEYHHAFMLAGNFDAGANTLSSVSIAAVPEPATLSLGAFVLLLLARKKR